MSKTVIELCEFQPGDVFSESLPLGPHFQIYCLRHRPTSASASTRLGANEPLTDELRERLLYALAIEVLSKTMTEEKWHGCPDATPMLKFLEGRAGRRKLRLFACAMCRLSLHLLTEIDGERLLREAEEAADHGGNEVGVPLCNVELKEYAAKHSINARGREAQRGEIEASHLLQRCRGDVALVNQSEWLAAWHNAMFASQPFLWTDPDAKTGGPADQVTAVRDVFGNPFRELLFPAPWRSATTLALANAMYESRDFSATPMLADALEEGGCDNADVLNHCRNWTRHVRGCWVVDFLLGSDSVVGRTIDCTRSQFHSGPLNPSSP